MNMGSHFEDELYELEEELNDVLATKDEYLPNYGYSHKDEIAELIREDIEDVKRRIESERFDYTPEELEAERTSLCISQGISRYC